MVSSIARLLSAACILATCSVSSNAAPVSFTKDIAPILQRNCVSCHSPEKARGKLVLSSHSALFQGSSGGAVVIPDRPGESVLIHSVQGTPPEMPPEGEPLGAAEIALLIQWIAEGAADDSAEALALPLPPLRPPEYQALPSVAALAYSPAQPVLAVAGHREVLLYDDQGELKTRLVGRLPRIDSLAFSPDGHLLAVAASDPSVRGEVQLWNPATGTLEAAYGIARDSLFGLSFSPSGNKLAAASAERIMRVLEIPGGTELIRFGNHTDWSLATAFSEDGQWIVSAGRDQSVRVLDAVSGRFISELAPQIEPVLCLAVHPSARQVVYGGEKGGVRVYRLDPKEGFKDPGDNKLHVRDYEHLGAPVYSIAYSRDGQWVAIGGRRDEVRVHQSDNGKRIATLRGHRGAIYSVSFDSSNSRIAAAGHDGLVRVYKLPSGELLQSFPSVPLSPVRRNTAAR